MFTFQRGLNHPSRPHYARLLQSHEDWAGEDLNNRRRQEDIAETTRALVTSWQMTESTLGTDVSAITSSSLGIKGTLN
jgi:hypothetical protein